MITRNGNPFFKSEAEEKHQDVMNRLKNPENWISRYKAVIVDHTGGNDIFAYGPEQMPDEDLLAEAFSAWGGVENFIKQQPRAEIEIQEISFGKTLRRIR